MKRTFHCIIAMIAVALIAISNSGVAQITWIPRATHGGTMQHLEVGVNNDLYTLMLTNPIRPWISNDKGLSWQPSTGNGLPNGAFTFDVRMTVTHSGTILISGFTSVQSIWRSTDGGNSFMQLTAMNGLPVNNYLIDGFTLAPSGQIYAYGNVVLLSTDDGVTWTQTATEDLGDMTATDTHLLGLNGSTLKLSDLQAVNWSTISTGAVSIGTGYALTTGMNNRLFAVGNSAKVITSLDEGTTWSAVSTGLSSAGFISRIAASPIDDQWVCGRPNDIFHTANTMSWSTAMTGLNLTASNQLLGFRATPDGSLFCWSNQGLWIADLTTGLDAETSNKVPFTLYPSPADDHVSLSIGTADLQAKTFHILDMNGRSSMSGPLRNMTDPIDVSGIPAGVYIMELYDEDEQVARERFVVE